MFIISWNVAELLDYFSLYEPKPNAYEQPAPRAVYSYSQCMQFAIQSYSSRLRYPRNCQFFIAEMTRQCQTVLQCSHRCVLRFFLFIFPFIILNCIHGIGICCITRAPPEYQFQYELPVDCLLASRLYLCMY